MWQPVLDCFYDPGSLQRDPVSDGIAPDHDYRWLLDAFNHGDDYADEQQAAGVQRLVVRRTVRVAFRGCAMSALLSLTASAVLLALGVWLLGGFVLRISGATLALGGLVVTASTGSPGTAVAGTLGVLAWFAGHWLYAFRHHYFSSPLASRIFLESLPAPLDPTRRWRVPNIPPGDRR